VPLSLTWRRGQTPQVMQAYVSAMTAIYSHSVGQQPFPPLFWGVHEAAVAARASHGGEFRAVQRCLERFTGRAAEPRAELL
jgi:hypothetical protein